MTRPKTMKQSAMVERLMKMSFDEGTYLLIAVDRFVTLKLKADARRIAKLLAGERKPK